MPANKHNQQLVQQYLEFITIQKRLALRTQQLYSYHLNQLINFASSEQLCLENIEANLLRYWLAQQHQQGYKPKALALMLSCWRGFYTWLVQQGNIEFNPVQDIRPPKASKPLPKALSIDDAMQLADTNSQLQANSNSNKQEAWLMARDSAIIELLYGCGLRVSELVSLDFEPHNKAISWIDLSIEELSVTGKGNKQRSLPIGNKAINSIRNWLRYRLQFPHKDLALFTNQKGTRVSRQIVWQRLRKNAQHANLSTNVHPHMLRHSFASHILQSSGDLRAVQELLGHASISSTQVYTKLDFQHLAKIYDKTHPRAKTKNNK